MNNNRHRELRARFPGLCVLGGGAVTETQLVESKSPKGTGAGDENHEINQKQRARHSLKLETPVAPVEH